MHIVSVDTPLPSAPCVLSANLGHALSDIVLLKNQFDLNRIKREFEEEELAAYNRKIYLSNLEQKQSAAAAVHRQAKTREKVSIDDLKQKMEKLVHTLETDVSNLKIPESDLVYVTNVPYQEKNKSYL